MHMTRILPTVAELVARAIAGTRFVAEITADEPHDVTICAELAAQLAAEQWERAHGALPGVTVPAALTSEAAVLLAERATELRETAIYDAYAKVERSIAALAQLRRGTEGRLPLPDAEALMDDIEDYFDIVGVKFKRTLEILQVAIDAIEHGEIVR